MSGALWLRETSALLRAMGACRKPDLLERLERVSVDHHRVLLALLEELPGAMTRPVMAALAYLTSPGSGFPGKENIFSLVSRLGHDPRSCREASRQLDSLASCIEEDSVFDGVVGRALSRMNDEGVLRMSEADTVSRFLFSGSRHLGEMTLFGGSLSFLGESHKISDWISMLERVRKEEPLAGPRAASLALYAGTHSKIDRLDAYAGDREVQVIERLPVLDSILPDETLVVRERSRVLLPSSTMERSWIAVDPIPNHLTEGVPSSDLFDFVSVYLRPDRMLLEPELRSTLEVVYVSTLAMATVVSPEWIGQLRGVEVRVMSSGSKNFSAYEPQTRTIWISTSPLSAWSLLHELAHAIDDELFDGPGMASEQAGSSLGAMADLLRPHYRAMAEARARWVCEAMLSRGLGEDLTKRLRKETLPLIEVLNEVDRDRADLLFSIVVSGGDLHYPEARSAARALLGHTEGDGRGQILLLAAVQDGLVWGPDGVPRVDIEEMETSVVDFETSYFLASPELFARLFSQYVRMFWRQNGWAFGPDRLPGDLEPETVPVLVPMLHDALLRTQVMDIRMASETMGREELNQKILAVLLSAFAFVHTEGIFSR